MPTIAAPTPLVTLLDHAAAATPTYGEVVALDIEAHRVVINTTSGRRRTLAYGETTQFFIGPEHARTQLRGATGARVAETFLSMLASVQLPAPPLVG